MKKTLIFSIGIMALLNVWQFMSSYQQSRAAYFSPAWATAKPPAANAISAKTLPQSASSAATTVSDGQTPPAAPPPAANLASADPVAAAAAKLSAAGLNPIYASLYLQVQAKTGTPWQLLAAVHKIETGQRGNTTATSYAGAQGPMQFMPSTFRAYAQDGNGDGAKNITDLDDAMLTAGRYLAAGGADKGRYSAALHNYNHSAIYVQNVLSIAYRLGLHS